MKIAFVSNAKSIHIVRWANAMAERGHNVSIIICANDVGDNKALYHEGIKIIPLRFSTPFGYYLNAGQLKRLVKKEKFDVVNIHYASGYGTLGRRAKLKDAVLNIWGSDVYDFPYQSKIKYTIVKKNLTFYKSVASTSLCMAKQAKKIVDRVYHITPFGVDTDLFKPMPEYKPQDKIIFGTVKTLSPKYGVADTIKAFVMLIKRLERENRCDIVEKLRYEIYGKGEQKDELQQLIDKNGMTDKIFLCGYVPNEKLPQIYNRFMVFNCNSVENSESFGVAAVEAMACGIPVQVSDADGFAEVVENGVTGLIAPKGDVDAIFENMYKLLLDNNLRQEMSNLGIERVNKYYKWSDNVNSMLEVYLGGV